jgi:eukaryotic-like serine/threonine-protein kinase
MSEDQSGRVLNGRYELTLRIGEGTTGDVYRAWATNLHRYTAVKLLKPDVVARVGWEEAVARFEREAKSGAQLESAHAVKVTDFDFDAEQGYPYIVMEHLEGVDLATHLKRVGHLSARETATVLEHVADVIAEAHAKGIVHRDLKPEHIFLTWAPGGRFTAKVIDFSIAKLLAQGSVRTGAFETWSGTQLGVVLGTLQYMSPEQLRGEAVDQRTDIWALAVIAFECLTAQNPFPLVSSPDPTVVIAAVTMSICEKSLPLPSEVGSVPDGFDAWFARAAARDTNERFQTVREAIDALRQVLAADDLGAESPAAPTQTGSLAEARWPGLGVTIPIALVATALGAFWLGRQVGRAAGADDATPATEVLETRPAVPAAGPRPVAAPNVEVERGVPIGDLPVEAPKHLELDAQARSPIPSAAPRALSPAASALSHDRPSEPAPLGSRPSPPAQPPEPAPAAPPMNGPSWL